MRALCLIAHRWGRWDHWFPLFEKQARHCLRCKKIETRDI
jgi:hypothetical protein